MKVHVRDIQFILHIYKNKPTNENAVVSIRERFGRISPHSDTCDVITELSLNNTCPATSDSLPAPLVLPLQQVNIWPQFSFLSSVQSVRYTDFIKTQ